MSRVSEFRIVEGSGFRVQSLGFETYRVDMGVFGVMGCVAALGTGEFSWECLVRQSCIQ